MADLVVTAGLDAAVSLAGQGVTVVVGPPGPPGPPGAGGTPPVVFVQSTPAASWLITHALPTTTPDVRLVVGTELVFADVEFPSATQVAVTFPTPTAGTAVLTT